MLLKLCEITKCLPSEIGEKLTNVDEVVLLSALQYRSELEKVEIERAKHGR